MTWKTAKLGDVCTIEKGNIGIMKAIPGEYPLVVLGEERKSHNEYQFNDEAVVIPLVSSTGHGHRSMKRIFFQSGKFSVGSILCAVIPKDKSKLSAEFLYRYLDFNKEKELVSKMKGMANVSLPIKAIATVEIPLPPIEEQKRLVEEFQKLETSNFQIKVELSHQLELISQLRKIFLREAMQGKLVRQDEADESAEILLEKIKAEKEKLIAEKKIKREKSLPEIKAEEIPFEVPNNWTWCRLGEICSQISDIDHNMPRAVKMGGVKFLSAKDLLDNGSINFDKNIKYISEEDFARLGRKIVPQRSDIIYSRIGAKLGKARIVENDERFLVSYSCCTIRTLSPNIKFLNSLLDSGFVLKQAMRDTTDHSIPDLGMQKIKEFLIPFPPQAEQKRIIEKLERLMKFCDELESNIRESKSQAESLLQVVLKEALEPKEEYSLTA